MEKPTIDEKTIKLIETILAKGDRVELIPVKNGIKVIHIERFLVSEQKETCSKR